MGETMNQSLRKRRSWETIIGYLILIMMVVVISGCSDGNSSPADEPGITKAWMSELDDSKLITQIAIPGTHDSATDWDNVLASNCFLDIEFVSTQSFDISTQLDKGIRFFDIRLAYENGVLRFHHSVCYLEQHFGSAINAAQEFLWLNPSEFVIFLIKQEHTSVSADKFWKRAHDVYFDTKEYAGLFYLEKRVLTVEEARGKIIIMGREGSSEHKHGFHVNWDRNTSHYESYSYDKDINDVMRYIVEDHFSMVTVDLDTKFAWIRQNLYLSGFCPEYGYQKTLFITFLSGEGNPRLDKTPRKIATYENQHTADWLNNSSYKPHPGIVAIDLAGDSKYHGDIVIEAVINQNF